MSRNLPPVLTEVICGVSFEPVKYFRQLNYGSVCDAFAKIGFSEVQEAVPIIGQMELPEGTKQEIVSALDNSRVWVVNPDNQRLFQFQLDRFLFNWRGEDRSQKYCGFQEVLRSFKQGLQLFLEVIIKGKPETGPALAQLELTYTNFLYQGEHWQSLEQLSSVFPVFADLSADTFPSAPESVKLGYSFWSAKLNGRVHVHCTTAIERKEPARKLIQVNITARGKRETDNYDNVEDWFTDAHDAIGVVARGIMNKELFKAEV